jgi:hypothetical protein
MLQHLALSLRHVVSPTHSTGFLSPAPLKVRLRVLTCLGIVLVSGFPAKIDVKFSEVLIEVVVICLAVDRTKDPTLRGRYPKLKVKATKSGSEWTSTNGMI